ncbi:MAG: prepilin-type N-terminal cleavage/methylation domain-containing protein [Patescibacteria group bacterium]|nr:prepilin-type N-terminal cleavage/methylation domain-containing protein [Patescibacteria group bacterium]MDE1945622.1 prepilin-type N-terminal cleavage/methylation domain-containing protein [Patescibacteria group bacterium]
MRKGFTLIELLIVIAIIVILTAIAYSSFSNAQAGSRDKKRVADLGSLQLSLEAYANRTGFYPTSTAALVPQYLAAMPVPPSGSPSGSNYAYHYVPLTESQGSSICTSYELWTVFEVSNSYLASARDFSSYALSPTFTNGGSFYLCNSGDASQETPASLPPLYYDVMPQ